MDRLDETRWTSPRLDPGGFPSHAGFPVRKLAVNPQRAGLSRSRILLSDRSDRSGPPRVCRPRYDDRRADGNGGTRNCDEFPGCFTFSCHCRSQRYRLSTPKMCFGGLSSHLLPRLMCQGDQRPHSHRIPSSPRPSFRCW